MGDSFTFGTDADDGERFTDLLPALAELEVVNLGVAGYGTDQELRVLEIEGLRYDPDIVILTVAVFNDLTDIGTTGCIRGRSPTTARTGELRLSKPTLTLGMRARTSSYLVEFVFQRLRNDNLTPTPGARSSAGGGRAALSTRSCSISPPSPPNMAPG